MKNQILDWTEDQKTKDYLSRPVGEEKVFICGFCLENEMQEDSEACFNCLLELDRMKI